MRETQSNLSVRVHERHVCELPAVVRVTDDDRRQLRLTGAAVNKAGVTPVTVIDCSTGGIGLNTTLFLPKFARLEVVIKADSETGRQDFQAFVCVRRVVMLDHTPQYFIGTSFEDAATAESPLLAALIEHLRSLNMSAARARAQAGESRA